MLLKIICSIALAGFLVLLYFGHTTPAIIGICISSLALVFNIFNPKTSSPNNVGPNFKIKSGKKSINNQTTGTINQTINQNAKHRK